MLRMAEWHAVALAGAEYDTWYDGRFFEKWADQRVVEDMPNTFALYSEDDIWRALEATMSLFHWVAMQTAEKLGFTYPVEIEKQATNWIRNCFVERDSAIGDHDG